MPERGWSRAADDHPPAASSAFRTALAGLRDPLHVLAEDVLADFSRIDFVAVDTARSAVGIWVAHEAAGTASLLVSAIAGRAWLADHIADFCKLAKELPVDPARPVRGILVSASFEPETLAAIRAQDDPFELVLLRDPRRGTGDPPHLVEGVFGERIEHPTLGAVGPNDEPLRSIEEPEGPPRPQFRSGLSDSELGLTGEERKDFE